MLSKQFRYIPYIFFFVSIFDNVVLTFGVEIFDLSFFITRVLQIAEIYFIGLTLLYIKQNYVILKEKRKYLLFFYLYCVAYFCYGLYKLFFSSDTLNSRAATASCLGFMQVGMIFFFQYEEVFIKYSRLWLNKMPLVILFFMLPFVNFFNWEIEFVPLCLFLLLWDCLSKRHKLLLIALILWCFLFNGQRAQIARIGFFLLILIGSKTFLFKKYVLYTANIILYVFPITMFLLASLDIFNIFSDSSQVTGSENIEVAGESLDDDTRTFLYVESINSAINDDYLMYGNSPASGYYSPTFERMRDEVGFKRLSEVFVINIFTWCGIPGVVFFMLLYMYSSFRCIGMSNNRYMKMFGIAISVSWLIDWFANSNYAMGVYHTIIYFMMGLSLNDKLLKMKDLEFKFYFKQKIYGLTYKRQSK